LYYGAIMRSAWSDEDAAKAIADYTARYPGTCNQDLALRTYTSRLIGVDARLVLHGGGNTSVKTELRDELGAPVEAICVKGSGWDLATIEPPGLPALRLEPLRALHALPALTDEEMVNALRIRLFDASAPNPSVETLLHAFLPHKFIDHSHADAILALVDQPGAEALCAEVFGGRLAIVPYIMPGFALAKLAAETYEANPGSEGLLLLQHGLFTYGASARESYERHVAAVDRAEAFLASRAAGGRRSVARRPDVSYRTLAPVLRGRLGAGGGRYVLTLRTSDAIRAFVDDPDLASLALRGPATPDHVIRTKRHPLLLDGLAGREAAGPGPLVQWMDERLTDYRRTYRRYVEGQIAAKGVSRTPLDPDPRVVLVPGLGLIGIGPTEKDARIAADIYEHTIEIIRDAEGAGRYQALPESDIFDMEYWSLEQAKLGKAKAPPLGGRVVYITGAASGIGAATARRFAAAGAHVFLVDRSAEPLERLARELRCGFRVVDVTDARAVEESIGCAVDHYGGIDGVVSNAGTAPQSPIADCSAETLRASLEVNLLSHQWVAVSATKILRAQGQGGFLLFNASKAAFNPGEGFGPYAVPKAALVALMKQYALEGGAHGIRANAVNADRIRTGLFPAEMVEARARARGLEPDAYFRSNLLGREVTADDVAAAFLALALAESTTGAVLTVDGGNIAASPR
jgi:rhamnose utilization protein RhaD (predicted bifunctional aldolase and dehydrogenase)/NAD(P)-dependent dehydrogenase (short-subunit alcohol dehydrogenase family)